MMTSPDIPTPKQLMFKRFDADYMMFIFGSLCSATGNQTGTLVRLGQWFLILDITITVKKRLSRKKLPTADITVAVPVIPWSHENMVISVRLRLAGWPRQLCEKPNPHPGAWETSRAFRNACKYDMQVYGHCVYTWIQHCISHVYIMDKFFIYYCIWEYVYRHKLVLVGD